MQAQITLTRFRTAPGAIDPADQHAFPITIQAVGLDIPSEIFVYRVGKEGDPFLGDQFSCIASVSQLSELPANKAFAITTNQQIPFYRTAQMELVCRTEAEVNEVWCFVQEDVARLINNYNLSFTLQGNVTSTISGDNIVTESNNMTPPTRLQLSYQPAGVATYVSSVQDVTSPNLAAPGWLPVSAVPPDWSVPPGAKFFYNIAQDASLQAIWPLNQPYSGNNLYRNGVLLPYGVVYVIDDNTIWWLDFIPATLPEYSRVGSVQDGNAPWPTDYVSPSSPGAVSPTIVLIAYK